MSAHRSLKQSRTSGRRQGRISAFISPRVIHARARKATSRQKRLAEETAEARSEKITLDELRERKYQEAIEVRKKNWAGNYDFLFSHFFSRWY